MIKIDVPYISQKGLYPTGCESVSAVMLLRFLGYDISVDEFIKDYLDCQNFVMQNGQLYGPDPRKHFCGSPYCEDDFGCYPPVICKALTKVFHQKEPVYGTNRKDASILPNNTSQQIDHICYEAIDESHTPIETLVARYLDKGMPVIFWACIDMKKPIIGPSWKLLDSGETFTWISNEHCMLMVGYDDAYYYFNDPYEGHGVIGYPKALVLDRHKAQYEMAVGVRLF